MNEKLLGTSDLKSRWNYTRAGINKLLKNEDFPKPFTIINKGKTRIFLESEIEKYEQGKTWLFDENEKLRRQKLFFFLSQIKDADEIEKKRILDYCFGANAIIK